MTCSYFKLIGQQCGVRMWLVKRWENFGPIRYWLGKLITSWSSIRHWEFDRAVSPVHWKFVKTGLSKSHLQHCAFGPVLPLLVFCSFLPSRQVSIFCSIVSRTHGVTSSTDVVYNKTSILLYYQCTIVQWVEIFYEGDSYFFCQNSEQMTWQFG